MSTKEKIIKEIDGLPTTELKYIHKFLSLLNKRRRPYKTIKKTENEYWAQLATEQFLKGYAKEDAIYDQL